MTEVASWLLLPPDEVELPALVLVRERDVERDLGVVEVRPLVPHVARLHRVVLHRVRLVRVQARSRPNTAGVQPPASKNILSRSKNICMELLCSHLARVSTAGSSWSTRVSSPISAASTPCLLMLLTRECGSPQDLNRPVTRPEGDEEGEIKNKVFLTCLFHNLVTE